MRSARRPPSAWSPFRLGLAALTAASLGACGGDSSSPLKASPASAPSSQLTTAIRFVQVAYATPQVNSASVTVKFPVAQTAGNLNVVAVGWNDTTARVTSVTDASGNSYAPAVGPTTYPGALTQTLYYAKNIAPAVAGANSVKVVFNVPAACVGVRILEYAGLDTAAPLDATAAASGSTNANDSGPLTTSGPDELLFAANMTTGFTSRAGAGFTSRVVTSPDGDIAEDQIAAQAGTYHGTAAASGVWVMQMAAFRSASVQSATAPGDLAATAASSIEIDLAWTASTGGQGIAGYRVERCQGVGCTSFAQIATPPGTTFADTSCAPNTAYTYRVRAVDTAGNVSDYSNLAGATTPADSQAPTMPGNLVAASASSSQINLSWITSTDNVAVIGYLVERCQGAGCTSFAQIATPAGNGYSDAGLLAATAYTYRVRATDADGNLSGYSDSASDATFAPSPSTPTLVQHVSSSTNPVGVGISGNAFKFTLPNQVGAGNCLILGISYDWTSTRTVRISDDNANAWPASPAATTTDGSDLVSSIFVLPNANAGVTTITVSFNEDAHPFQYTISEFYNVATVSPVNGSSARSTTVSPDLTTGSFTPAANNDADGGNLIWSYFCDHGGGTGNWTTTFAAGTGFTLLDADIGWHEQGLPHASQYVVQAKQAAINPGMTATMTAGNDTYNALSVALKAAPAGTAPPAGIRIVRISHFTNETPPAVWDLQFPSTGNLIVLVTSERSNHDITSIRDTQGNTYLLEEPDDTEPQVWYVPNASPHPDLKLTINFTGQVVGTSVAMYDIAGADPSPLDGAVGVISAADNGGANLSNTPSITPVSLGLTIAVLTLGQGPSSGLDIGAPAGAVFDVVTYAGETDLDTMVNADGKAHLYNTDLTPENWNWIISNGGQTTGFAATAVHFKAAATTTTAESAGAAKLQRH